jgi:heavy metal sensor kinase
MASSIKTRVVLFYAVILFVILSILGVFLYLSLVRIVYDSIDSSLISKAKALATLIKDDGDETEFGFSDDVMWEYSSPKSKSFFQIRRLDGTIIEKSESIGALELPFSPGAGKTTFSTIRFKGMKVRMVTFYVPVDENSNGAGAGFIVQCAEEIEEKTEILETYRTVLFVSILGIMVISAVGGFFIAGKALAPVKDFSRAVDRISESNLSERIGTESVPTELKVLASSFNTTFGRLEKSFKRQKQFVSDASHELRTPLSVILSQSEITLKRKRSAEEYRGVLTAIMEASVLMSRTVEKLITLARLGTDRIELKIEEVDLDEVITEVVKLVRPLALQNDIAITVSAHEPHTVSGDREALLELFTNLVDNAIKYNLPHGKIDISIRKDGVYVVTEIRDTGIGISESDLPKVLDRFYRVDQSRSNQINGAGLGLSICDKIVELHGGRLEIRSGLGEGTTVEVYLKDCGNVLPS